MKTSVGVIGLGIMGGAISGNLLKSGFAVIGYDPVKAKRDALAGKKGDAAASCREVAERCDFIITSLPSVAAWEKVISGSKGILAGAHKGLIVVETSTLPLDAKEKGHEQLQASGVSLLDAPLSGTGAQAATRDLAVYASGERKAYRKCLPIFRGFARAPFYVGEFGAGSKMKFVANLLVAIHNVSAAEAFVLGRKAGLDPELIYQVISSGAGSSRMFEVRGPMMVSRSYGQPTMKVKTFLKDIDIITRFAREMGSPTPLLKASAKIYDAAMSSGRSRQDTAAVCAVLENMG